MEKSNSVSKSLKRACDVYRRDLDALPEEAFSRSMGGKARTVADITYEVCLVNDDIARSVRGESISEWPEGWIVAPPELRSKQAILAVFDKSASAICSLFASFTEDELGDEVTTEHGETDRAERARFATLHLWYHSGQLNFIQTLLGDDEWHWN